MRESIKGALVAAALSFLPISGNAQSDQVKLISQYVCSDFRTASERDKCRTFVAGYRRLSDAFARSHLQDYFTGAVVLSDVIDTEMASLDYILGLRLMNDLLVEFEQGNFEGYQRVVKKLAFNAGLNRVLKDYNDMRDTVDEPIPVRADFPNPPARFAFMYGP